MAPPKVLKNKKADGVGIKTGLCPDVIQRRNRWSAKPKTLLAYKRLGDSMRGALKACCLLGREATTSRLYFIAASSFLDYWRLRRIA